MAYVTVKQCGELAPSCGHPFKIGGGVPPWNKPDGRWCERPSAAGLRLVGFADEVARSNGYPRSIDHKGWYCNEFQDEIARGQVFRLPHGRFLAAIADPDGNGDAAIIALESDNDEMKCAHRADRMAEKYAEAERKYRECFDARMRYEGLGEDITTNRRRILTLCRAIKSGEHDDATHHRWVEELLKERSDYFDERRQLLNDYGRTDGWRDF